MRDGWHRIHCYRSLQKPLLARREDRAEKATLGQCQQWPYITRKRARRLRLWGSIRPPPFPATGYNRWPPSSFRRSAAHRQPQTQHHQESELCPGPSVLRRPGDARGRGKAPVAACTSECCVTLVCSPRPTRVRLMRLRSNSRRCNDSHTHHVTVGNSCELLAAGAAGCNMNS